jgi:thiol-disulfide isomerase/thioredoxin
MTRDDRPRAPAFPPAATWVQGGPVVLADPNGHVTVVHFWTNGCINCIRNYPLYRDWADRYKGRPVRLVGVHTPEFDHEAPADVVRKKLADNKLTFATVLDTDRRIWAAWRVRYWPTIFLVDKAGRVRHYWEGELHLRTPQEAAFAGHIATLLGGG